MSAFNRELLTKVVARALPFQVASAPGRNPEPFTVNVKAGPPGTAVVGING